MTIQMQKELEKIKKKILELGARVEDQLKRAVECVSLRDTEMAKRIIQLDEEIDRLEIDIEEECLKVIALNQPVAIDLRFLIAVIKINSALERIGDHAVNISERALTLSERFKNSPFVDFSYMSKLVLDMVELALDSLVKMDTDIAHKVCMMDDYVDEENKRIYSMIKDMLCTNQEETEEILGCLLISRQLERIGDLATNIAEDVIYMVGGDIVRHPLLSREE